MVGVAAVVEEQWKLGCIEEIFQFITRTDRI